MCCIIILLHTLLLQNIMPCAISQWTERSKHTFSCKRTAAASDISRLPTSRRLVDQTGREVHSVLREWVSLNRSLRQDRILNQLVEVETRAAERGILTGVQQVNHCNDTHTDLGRQTHTKSQLFVIVYQHL